jgi:hypothetical protein
MPVAPVDIAKTCGHPEKSFLLMATIFSPCCLLCQPVSSRRTSPVDDRHPIKLKFTLDAGPGLRIMIVMFFRKTIS